MGDIPTIYRVMSLEAAIAWADALMFQQTGAHLTELQSTILQFAWQGKPYIEIAQQYGCTEGHAKDTGADLWKLLSESLDRKISKRNFRSVALQHSASTPDPVSRKLAPTQELKSHESAQFVGRDTAIKHLKSLEEKGINAIVIQGEGGLGKTTLAHRYLETNSFDLILELLIAKETDRLTPVEGVVEEWLKRDFQEEPGREFGVTLSRLKRHLQRQRVGVLIDNLEPALDQSGQIIAPHHHYGELLRVLTDRRNQGLTLITSRDRLCESGVTVEHYRLPGLAVTAWQCYWENHQIECHPSTLNAIHKTYGGNAKAMQIIGGIIREDFNGDSQRYWHDASYDPLQAIALKNLVTHQLDRLATLDPAAHQLLCRLGCYRFQENPTLPKAGLIALLWDIPPNQHSQVIQSLRNRSLVEFDCGEYWLHPVIRAEAIARLKQSGDWQEANCHAADYWTDRVSMIATVTDGLQAWEAFYHQVAIQNFDAASQVILQSRHNQWKQYLPLGSLLHRMGLSQLVLSGILQIIDRVQPEGQRSELNNILGDLYWVTGELHRAIACQEKALTTASDCLERLKLENEPNQTISSYQHKVYYFRMLKIDALFSLGLYQFDLWELEEAETLLEQVIRLGAKTRHERWAEKASVCLALVQSYLDKTDPQLFVQSIYEKVMSAHSPAYTGRFAYFIQRLGQIYANVGNVEVARELYERAIAFAKESQYKQVIAVSTSGLAALDRHQTNYNQALNRHRQAVQILDDIGATCDLAEAYFQWGITLQQTQHDAVEQFEEAIALYTKIDAPLQVERVRAIALR